MARLPEASAGAREVSKMAEERQATDNVDTTEETDPDDPREAAVDVGHHPGGPGWFEKNAGWLVWVFGAVVVAVIWTANVIRDESVSGWVKALIFVVAAVLFVVAVAVLLQWLRKRYSWVEKWTNAIGLALLAVAFGVIPVLVFSRGEQMFLLELVVIVLFAMIPGFLYLQFLAVRGLTLWEEYVVILVRLEITEFGPLPTVADRDRPSNLYAQKFRAVYGLGRRSKKAGRSAQRSQGETLVPMLWVTVVSAIGWTLVIQPEPLRTSDLWIKNTTAVPPTFNGVALMIAFVGAYFFVVQLLSLIHI